MYVVPGPTSVPGAMSSIGLIRRIAPRRSFVLPALRRSSNPGFMPGALLFGAYPSAPGAPAGVLSPVDRKRLPSASHAMSAPTWQHWPRCASTLRIARSLSRSSVLLSASHVKRESWL
ncbi:hypothetical protein IU11_12725 [Cellulosimicrobium sp. MM]|nr:hypothetical protein IU11_12725 [Cellulosimicrobium sp. MM]